MSALSHPPAVCLAGPFDDGHTVDHARDAHRLSVFAVASLVDEAELTPKPALVDQRGSGAHVDLDLHLMLCSAHSLQAGFAAMAQAAQRFDAPCVALRERLAHIGRQSEQDMLVATGGRNAHRGAIWIVGLLLSAAALKRDADVRQISEIAATIARLPDRHVPASVSHGARIRARYGALGARGEAMSGFPHVVDIGLPTLHGSRARGDSETDARLNTLIAIMANLEDTCLLHRGGQEALLTAQHGARSVMAAGGAGTIYGRAALLRLDADLLARNASPGGGADLLAATLFMDRIQSDGWRGAPSE